MAAEEQEIDWIYFELNECKLRIDPDNSNNIQKWRDTYRGILMKKPYWRQVSVYKIRHGYYQCSIGMKKYYHHRVVYWVHYPDWNIHDNSHDNVIDHIDGNPSNNHISNLRVATQGENMQNSTAKGYTYDKINKKWRSNIKVNGKIIHLGRFETEEEAHEAYIKAKREHHPFFHES